MQTPRLLLQEGREVGALQMPRETGFEAEKQITQSLPSVGSQGGRNMQPPSIRTRVCE
ncbi:unnamed protein product [Lepidochelys olivacea]